MAAGDSARIALASVRLVNGTAALLQPGLLARGLGADPEQNPALLYALRMFGVRTVVIGLDLLRREPPAMRSAVPIHASDTLAAVVLSRQLPREKRALVVGISALNTVLALLLRRRN